MESFRDVSVCLLQQLSHQQHHGRCAIAADVVLGSRGSSNHDGSRVLDLHFSQQDVSILGKLDLLTGEGWLGIGGRSLRGSKLGIAYLSGAVDEPATLLALMRCRE